MNQQTRFWQVREAAASANALDFIVAAPAGFDTMVSFICAPFCEHAPDSGLLLLSDTADNSLSWCFLMV